MPHDEQAYDYHMVEEMIEYIDLFIEHQVPGILPWHLLAAQCRWESSFDPCAVSRAGAQGIAQFMPQTWAAFTDVSPFNPRESVRVQSKYMLELAMLHMRTGKISPWWWVVSYTWGFGRVQRLINAANVPHNVSSHAYKVIDTSEYYRSLLSYSSNVDC